MRLLSQAGTLLKRPGQAAQNATYRTSVNHGSTAGTARPAGVAAGLVEWYGSVAPTNALTDDRWYDTANELSKRYTGSAWVAAGSTAFTAPVKAAAIFGAATANNPVIVAHRFGALPFPENTEYARKAAVAGGFYAWKTDAVIGADGALLAQHDPASESRTISNPIASGTPADETAQSWKARLALPPGLGTGYPAERAMLINETFDAVQRGEGVAVIEGKVNAAFGVTAPATARLIAETVRRNLQKSVVIGVNSLADIATVKAAGCLSCYIYPGGGGIAQGGAVPSLAALVAAAPDMVNVSLNYSDADLSAVVAACAPTGIWVTSFTLARRAERTRAAGLGIPIHFADDPFWVAGVTTPAKTDGWADGVYSHGTIGSSSLRGTLEDGGLRMRPALGTFYQLIGRVCPIPAWLANTGFTIDVDVVFNVLPTVTSDYLSLFLSNTDDGLFTAGAGTKVHDGYHLRLNSLGSLRIDRYNKVGNSQTTICTAVTTTAPTAGGLMHLKWTIPALGGSWKAQRTDSTGWTTGTAVDDTLRGTAGMLFAGKFNDADVTFKNLVIAP